MSNYLSVEPIQTTKRYDRKVRKMTSIQQPFLIHKYNNSMGGVDLFDNAVNNYRIKVRGKKWYWPLITNGLDAAMVNAWKIRAKPNKTKPMSQLDFRVSVAEALLQRRETCTPTGKRTGNISQFVENKHIVSELEKRRRCRQCGVKTFFGCVLCNENLHPKNCFADFHNGEPKDLKKIQKAK